MDRKRRPRFLITLLAVAAVVAVWAPLAIGCALPFDDSDSDTPALSDEERQAIVEAEMPVYGVGQEYQGLPLARALTTSSEAGPPAEPPTNSISLVYGDCTPTGGDGLDGPTCVPPLSIRTHAYCTRTPEMLGLDVEEESFSLRGATAIWVDGGAGHPTLRLYTADATISIRGESRKTVLDVANHLYSMTPSAGVQSPDEDLGAPAAAC